MCFFHWGVHGWIPYILLAINASIVSHRWGLPMTIRSCFYPLIGEHIYSFLGDLIDSISMACTTFGVCTSLGLGVFQLSEGLRVSARSTTTHLRTRSTLPQARSPTVAPLVHRSLRVLISALRCLRAAVYGAHVQPRRQRG